MTNLVRSPAGQEIEVVPDDEFLEVFETTRGELAQWKKRRPLLAALWQHGPFENESGRATQLWLALARSYGYTASAYAINAMLNGSKTVGACIERTQKGKRTYSIELVRLPQLYYDNLRAEVVGPRKAPPGLNAMLAEMPEPEPVIEVQMPAPDPEPIEVPTQFDSLAVAQHLLALVIDKINEPTQPGPELKALGHRLAEQVEYGQRMREEARQAGVRIDALIAERDELQRDLTLIKTRFDTMLSREQREALDDQLRRLMQAPKGGRDG